MKNLVYIQSVFLTVKLYGSVKLHSVYQWAFTEHCWLPRPEVKKVEQIDGRYTIP